LLKKGGLGRPFCFAAWLFPEYAALLPGYGVQIIAIAQGAHRTCSFAAAVAGFIDPAQTVRVRARRY
jgi:hypothetical protein